MYVSLPRNSDEWRQAKYAFNYGLPHSLKVSDEEYYAFMGFKNPNALPVALPPRAIPWGDSILNAFIFHKTDYLKTHSGYFKKSRNGVIVAISKNEHDNAYKYWKTSLILSSFPLSYEGKVLQIEAF